jgi:hypothetical protein
MVEGLRLEGLEFKSKKARLQQQGLPCWRSGCLKVLRIEGYRKVIGSDGCKEGRLV